MTASPVELDHIAAQLRAEDLRLRRRTLWLSALPVLISVAVLVLAWQGVAEAQRQREALLKQVADAGQQKAQLDERVAAQQAAIQNLEVERAALDRDIASRKDLIARFAPQLPPAPRAELDKLTVGIDEAKRGNLDAAIASYQRAISADAANPLPYRLSGDAYYQDGKYGRAIAQLRQALKLNPNDANSRYTLGLALWAQGGHEQAAADEISRAFDQDPAVRARGLQDPAFRPIRTYLDANAGQASGRSADEKAAIDRGLSAAKQGDFDAAIAGYEAALRINPANAQVWQWLGYAAFRGGQYDKAETSLKQALTLAPREGEVHYNLALVLWKMGRQDDAVASLQRAYAVEPTYRAVAEGDPQSRALRAALPRR